MEYLGWILDAVFPKKCVNCGKEGSHLCEDCFSLIEINPFEYCLCEKMEKRSKCPNCQARHLDRIYSATSSNTTIVKKIINGFENKGLEDLAAPLSVMILRQLQIMNAEIDKNFLIAPVPMDIKKKKRIGFGPAEKIAELISEATGIPLLEGSNCKDKKVLLIDAVYSTGTEMEKFAKELKENGAEEVSGATAAREISVG